MEKTVELVIVLYNDPQQAENVFPVVQRLAKGAQLNLISGAVLAKKLNGQMSVKTSRDIHAKRGTHYGAIAGSLLGILAPPIGAAGLLASAAIGAAIGRSRAKKGEQSLLQDFLNKLSAEMPLGSSTLVLLMEAGSFAHLSEGLAEYGGLLFHQPLSDEELDRLAGTAETADSTTGPNDPYANLIAQVKEAAWEARRQSGLAFQKVHVIINPASGQDRPILNTLNTIFHAAKIDWAVSITQKAGDARQQAREAAEAGVDVVAVYGGDGTVTEAASGLLGSETPLAILPGGTNNVMSVELGVPRDLAQAATLLAGAPATLQAVDMGRANDHLFILRVGIGFEALVNEGASREAKDKYGGFAYSIAGLRALRNPPNAIYRMELDGEYVEMEGFWCLVANSANMGAQGLIMGKNVDVSDGLLDVIMVRNTDLDSLRSMAASVASLERLGEPLPQWKVRQARIVAEPPQAMTGDGELWESTPLEASVIPQAVRIVVPARK